MRYIEMRENREHGTPEFPYAYYIVSETHPRYFTIGTQNVKSFLFGQEAFLFH